MIESVKQFLCEPHHLMLLMIGILIAVILGGKLGMVIRSFIKAREIKNIINIEEKGGDVAVGKKFDVHGPICAFDPSQCAPHQAEHERSLKNEASILEIFKALSDIKKEMRDGNERILLALVAGGQIKPEHIPPKK